MKTENHLFYEQNHWRVSLKISMILLYISLAVTLILVSLNMSLFGAEKFFANINIGFIFILIVLTTFGIFLPIYLKKLSALKFYIEITDTEFIFKPQNNGERFLAEDFISYEIISSYLTQLGIVDLIFKNVEIRIRTAKLNSLRVVLENLMSKNKSQNNKNSNVSKPARRLFYEDSKKTKKNILIAAGVLTFLFLGWTVCLIMAMTMPISEDLISAGFKPMTVTDMAFFIFFLVIAWGIILTMYIYALNSKKLKFYFTITEDEFILNFFGEAAKRYSTKGLCNITVINLHGKSGNIELTIWDEKLNVRTKKYAELKSTLDYLMERNTNKL